MNERMKSLLKENSMCVLATSSDDKPHCSLMAYVTDEDDVNTLFMVTPGSSRKFRNLSLNHHVSLLVDTRADSKGDRGNILALTVSGVCLTVENRADKDAILRRIVGAHPHLQDLAYHPEAEVISVRVETLLLLEGATTAHFEEL
jgi:nitroimidazol reductase NimA-like FMN-containing flavoprotein (pyridoxamine 5'-phosphate oxidase superfamily)